MSTQNNNPKTGVVLMTYGSATTAEHVSDYFKRIYGENVSAELIEDFEERYRMVGHSPLIEITTEQARLLSDLLGENYIVEPGMRHSAPYIDDAVAACKKRGASSLIGVILAPQLALYITKGYSAVFNESARKHGYSPDVTCVAPAWPTEQNFIKLLTERVLQVHAELMKTHGVSVPVVFTTHSLPERVLTGDPHYLEQLQATIESVLKSLPPTITWYSAYQSAGHSPEPWLKPDLVDILRIVRADNAPAVLIVPFQFLSDHLEILYDLDIAARAQCTELNLEYHRITLPNTDPLFISALASVVETTKRK